MRMARFSNFARWLIAAVLLSAAVWIDVQAAHAQSCGGDYTIKEGESLADISARVYGSSSQWPLIFYANQDRMGANASMLVPGLSIRIPCMSGQSPSASHAPAAGTPTPSAATPAPVPAPAPVPVPGDAGGF